jgi:mediator of RNA polymerase II transcription subunit 6
VRARRVYVVEREREVTGLQLVITNCNCVSVINPPHFLSLLLTIATRMDVNLQHVQWRAPEFLLALPQGQLSSRHLALDYFAASPFFDKQSSNAQLRMQMLFSRQPADTWDEERQLARFTGIEYVVAALESDPPDLWIIHKRRRTSPSETRVLAAYHILNGNVYLAPTLFHILNERLLTSTHALATAFNALVDLKPTWTPERQYAWDIKQPPPVAAVASNLGPDESATAVTLNLDPQKQQEEDEDPPHEEEEERPGETFNPLLFRALQTIATRTEAEAILAHQQETQQAAAKQEAAAAGTGSGEEVKMGRRMRATASASATPAPTV